MDESSRICRIVEENRQEAEIARKDRMDKNQTNFNIYHLKQDFTHKKKGQSTEFLSKQAIAVEQTSSFIMQGLVNTDRWFDVEVEPGVENPVFTPREVYLLLKRQMDINHFSSFVSDSAKLGLLGSLMIVKVHGEKVNKPRYTAEDVLDGDKIKKKLFREDRYRWQSKLELFRQEDYYPDPTGRNQYQIIRTVMDKYKLIEMAKENPEIFDLAMIESLNNGEESDQLTNKHIETDQNLTATKQRQTVTLYEFWGDLVDHNTGEVLHRDCVCITADDSKLISKPRPYPFWHGKRPFVVTPIIRVPHSVWHRAAMDSATAHNIALNELYNLMVDSAMMAAFGIRQIKTSYLEDPSQVNEGIGPGTTLSLNASAPDNVDVLKRVDTSTLGNETMAMYSIVEREFQQSAMSNDLRVGSLPQREVKATEVMASSQALNSLFDGLIKVLETDFITPILQMAWETMCQELDDFDLPEIESLLGKERAAILMDLEPEERFAAGIEGFKFKVYGLSNIMNRINDFRKVQSMLQTLGASPVLVQEFAKQFSFSKTLEYIMRSLDIDTDRLKERPQSETSDQTPPQAPPEQLAALMGLQQGQQGGDGGSQIPSASAPGPLDGQNRPPRSEIQSQIRAQNG